MAKGLSPVNNPESCSSQWYLQGVGEIPIDGTFAAGSFTTIKANISSGSVWQIQVGASNGASGTVTFQQSADGVFWDDLPNSTLIPIALNDSVTIESFYLSGIFVQAIYTETTAGTLSMILTQK